MQNTTNHQPYDIEAAADEAFRRAEAQRADIEAEAAARPASTADVSTMTAAQRVALDALAQWHYQRPGAYAEATALGVSGAALSALVRKGYARRSGALSRNWSADAYRITTPGLRAR